MARATGLHRLHTYGLRPSLRECYIPPGLGPRITRMEFKFKSQVMDAAGIARAISRLASEIVERNVGTAELLLVGIRRRGVPLAERIATRIEQLEGDRPPTGQLDITLYRDD